VLCSSFVPAAAQRLEVWFCSGKLGRKEGNIMAPAATAAAAATEVEVTAWAAKDTSGHLAPFTFSRR